MLKNIYKKTMSMAAHPQAKRWLFGVSFIESSIFPLPPDILLIPMCLEKREKAFYYAGLCTIASVLGGILGYAIGYFFWATIGDPLVNFYGFQSEFGLFEEKFVAYGFWIVFVFGITFFPYKVITIASGFVALNPVAFILASVASRGLRFFIEAGLLWKFGEKIQDFIEKKLALAVSLAVLIIVALVVGYKIFSG